MMPDRTRIEGMVPHAGAMCLLDAVIEWDDTHIACAAARPDASHPLARDGQVPAIAAAEYAAQATALHGALLDDCVSPRAGMLAKLVDVNLYNANLPGTGSDLRVRAEMLGRLATGCMYSFEVANNDGLIANGRLIVAFQPVPTT